MAEYHGEGIYAIGDVAKYVELLPESVNQEQNPLIQHGVIKNE